MSNIILKGFGNNSKLLTKGFGITQINGSASLSKSVSLVSEGSHSLASLFFAGTANLSKGITLVGDGQSITPVFTGQAILAKDTDLFADGISTAPIFTGQTNLQKDLSIVAVGSQTLPIFNGQAVLEKNVNLSTIGDQILPIFSGQANLQKNVNLIGVGSQTLPVFAGRAVLEKNIGLIGIGNQILPVFTGQAFLEKDLNLLASGTSNVPVFTGAAKLEKDLNLIGIGNHALALYSGSAHLQKSFSLNSDADFITPIYTGVARLSKSKSIIARGSISSPGVVYTGRAALYKSVQLETFSTLIIDDSHATVTSNFFWDESINKGYNNTTYKYFSPGTGGSTAWFQWNYNAIPPANYDLYVTWVPHQNRSSSAKYEIYDGNNLILTSFINQQISPIGPMYGGVPFQKLLTTSIANNNVQIRVYGKEFGLGIVVADATMIVRSNQFIRPVYSGIGNLYKSVVFGSKPFNIVPVYNGSSRLNIKSFIVESKVTRIFPVYTGQAFLDKHPYIDSFGLHTAPVYTGNMSVTVPVNLNIGINSIVPLYTSSAKLHSGHIEIISEGQFFVPVYSGKALLDVRPVLIANGVNIVEGFIYRDVLYMTDKIVKVNYFKDGIQDVRYVMTRLEGELYGGK